MSEKDYADIGLPKVKKQLCHDFALIAFAGSVFSNCRAESNFLSRNVICNTKSPFRSDQKVRPEPIKLDALRVFKQKFGLVGRLFSAK